MAWYDFLNGLNDQVFTVNFKICANWSFAKVAHGQRYLSGRAYCFTRML